MEGVKSLFFSVRNSLIINYMTSDENQNPNKNDKLAEGKALNLFSIHITILTWGSQQHLVTKGTSSTDIPDMCSREETPGSF